METIINLLQNNPSALVWMSAAAIVFVYYGLYPFLLWLRSLSTTNQAIATAHSADQRSSDALTDKALNIIADNTTATNATFGRVEDLLRKHGEDITHIRTTTDQHHNEFKNIDLSNRLTNIDNRLTVIEQESRLARQGIRLTYDETKLVRQGVIYIARHSEHIKLTKELT